MVYFFYLFRGTSYMEAYSTYYRNWLCWSVDNSTVTITNVVTIQIGQFGN